jgi:hypothetical protein
MKQIRTVKNPYRGINTHINSYWQAVDGWHEFHTAHITLVTAALKRRLLPMGYIAKIEDSVQIRRFSQHEPDEKQRRDSDIGIYRLAGQAPALAGASARLSGLVMSLEVAFEDNPLSEHTFAATVIYRMSRQDGFDEIPVAWIELLSPSNKRHGDDGRAYREKRDRLLNNGVIFVEIDYLDITSPTLPSIPDYTKRDPDAHPYRILVMDPRPSPQRGLASLNEFDVDTPIPSVVIPLMDDEYIDFPFDEPYQRTFEDVLFGFEPYLNYAELPKNFDRFNAADQTRIVRRMVAILEAAAAGTDLESAPLPIPDLSLDDALQRLATLKLPVHP